MAEQTWVQRLRGGQGVGMLLLLSLLFVAALHSTSIPDAIDASLQSAYYRAGIPSSTEQRVLLVEADDETTQHWGSPPWTEQRRRALLDRIAQGQPAALVVVDGARMFPVRSDTADAPPPDDGLPSSLVYVELSTHIDPGSNQVDSLSDGDVRLRRLDPVLEVLEHDEPRAEQLPIHYLWPRSRLPTMSFKRIEQGDVPPSIFEDKVVVVGLTSPDHRDALATPIGALTSPEIISHTFAMVADGRRFHEPSWLVRVGGLLLVLAATMLAMRGTTPSQAVVRVAALLAVLLAIDLVLFSRGLMRWGVSTELIVVVSILMGHWYRSQQDSAALVQTVSSKISEQLESETVGEPAPEDGFWQDIAETASAYLELDFTGALIELPEGQWHLQTRAFMNMDEEGIAERRRDVRRPPYRAAFLTHKPHRCERPFMADESRYTLAVPLAFEGRLYGMWMVGLDKQTELERSDKTLLEQLGHELGRSIAAARRGKPFGESLPLSSGDMAHRFAQLIHGVEALGQDKRRVVDTFDALPMGLLVANIWGHIVQSNAALRSELADQFPDGIPNNDLRAVLSRVTGTSLEGVHGIMRTVIRTGNTVRLRSAEANARDSSFLLMPMQTEGSTGAHASSEPATHLVLMIVPEDMGPTVDMLVRIA
ncbi:MAG: CHASE2 domain-containing protein [Myxococcota bacterium]